MKDSLYIKSACTSIEKEQPLSSWERVGAVHRKGNTNSFQMSRKVTDPMANERHANYREQTSFFMDHQSKHLKWDEMLAMSVGKAILLSVAGENVYNCWGELFTKCGGLNVSLPQSSAFEHLLLSWWNCFGEAWPFWGKRSLWASFEGLRALSTLGSLATYKTRCGGTCFPWVHSKLGASLGIWDPIFKTSVIYLGAYFRSY